MKRLIWVALLLGFVGPAAAAEETNVTILQPAMNADTIRYALTTERRSIFEEAMPLAPAQKEAFWNLYGQWEKERGDLDKRSLNLVSDYVQKFTTMTNEQAMKMVNESAQNQKEAVKLRQKYAKKMADRISGTVAGRFWQIDDYLTSAVKLGVLNNIPLLGDKVSSSTAPATKKK